MFSPWLILGQNYCIYTYEDNEWVLKGCYEVAIRDNEEAIWIQIGEDYFENAYCMFLFVCFLNV